MYGAWYTKKIILAVLSKFLFSFIYLLLLLDLLKSQFFHFCKLHFASFLTTLLPLITVIIVIVISFVLNKYCVKFL